MVDHLSSTGINMYLKNKWDFYDRYILKKPFEQSEPMRKGSAWDAQVKARYGWIGESYGYDHKELLSLYDNFIKLPKGKAFIGGEDYRTWNDIWNDIRLCVPTERINIFIEQRLKAKVGDAIIYGVPDMFWLEDCLPAPCLHILDWKFTTKKSPEPGYHQCFPDMKIGGSGKTKWDLQLNMYRLLLEGSTPASGCASMHVHLILERGRVATYTIQPMEIEPLIQQVWAEVNDPATWSNPEDRNLFV